MTMLVKLAFLSLLFLVSACAAHRDAIQLPNVQLAGTYSNVAFVDESGDIVGVEMHIVPSPGEVAYQAAVLIAEGGPGPLVVAEVQEVISPAHACRWITINLGAPYAARIEGCVEIDAFVGKLLSKSGAAWDLRLPRRAGYWSRSDG